MPDLHRPLSGRPASPELRYQHLSQPRKRLLLVAQRVGFGTIENLQIRAGEPVLDPPPRVVRRCKNGATPPLRPSAEQALFALKAEWVAFYQDLSAIGDGVILRVELAHGLPILHEVEETISR